ncbi:hypothetical protein Acid345_2055 [Candidatus Koribacter versatilis Ellin345]|uniref:Uncharacterized protein n=2 Tax=Candidatus Korobacter versatilis TaxID=658062 RepID=Q1IPZ4_KORVE|nr:hypothetical protein Acid345_2055 [Candidatus Koribacter versatilis Ellin345]
MFVVKRGHRESQKEGAFRNEARLSLSPVSRSQPLGLKWRASTCAPPNRSSAMNKRVLKIAGIVVGVILVILIAIPLFVNVETFRPKIEASLSEALGREVKLGKMSLSIFSGSLSVDNISIADDPAFSKAPFVSAKSLKIGVELGALIFSKQIKVTGFKLEKPEIMLLSAPNGTWNFSTLGAKNAPKTSQASSGAPSDVTIAHLSIDDGKLTVAKANSSAKAQVFDKLDVKVNDFSMASQFPFEVSVDLPGGGDAKITGKAGPVNQQDAAKTPFDAKLKVNKLDVAASGFVDASTGIGGIVGLEGTLSSNGTQAKGAGEVTMAKAKLSPKGTPAPKDITLKYALTADLEKQSGNVSQGDIGIGKASARLTGVYSTHGDVQSLNMNLNAPNMPVDELEAFLPAMGVTLPSGSKLEGGTLSADLAINGPLDKLVITGPVKLSNTKLAGFSATSKLSALSAFGGKVPQSPDTTIQNASLNARVAPEATKLDAINVVAPSLGTVTGAGTISPAGALDFKMQADMKATGAIAQQAGVGGMNGPIPFSIQGTTSNPTFVPDAGAIASSVAKSAIQKQLGDKSGITSLFGKKKSK